MIAVNNKTLAQLLAVFHAANELVANPYAIATCTDSSPVDADAEVGEQWGALTDALEENADDIFAFAENMGPF